MHTPTPTPLDADRSDTAFLSHVANLVLGGSTVAATTAARLISSGIDAARVDALIPESSVGVELDGYVFKKIAADQESPGNYGLFVRRRGRSASPFVHRKHQEPILQPR